MNKNIDSITDTKNVNTNKNVTNKFGGIYTFVEPEIFPISLAQGVSSIGGNNVILNE
jgi:hypothetical protein